jgi:antitoxin component of MazEF toxin-antitoxin module
MLQKIIKVGNSLAITLPAKFLKELGLEAGATIRVIPDSAQKVIIITPEDNPNVPTNLTPEFFEWLKFTQEEQAELIKQIGKV